MRGGLQLTSLMMLLLLCGRFTWRPYAFADTDQTAAKIELAQMLRGWG